MYLRPEEWGGAGDSFFCDTMDLPVWTSTGATHDPVRDLGWPTRGWVPTAWNPLPNQDNRLPPKRVRRVR